MAASACAERAYIRDNCIRCRIRAKVRAMFLPRVLTIAAAMAAVSSSVACRPSAAAHTRQSLRYLSWTSSGAFSNDFVARVQKLLPDTDIHTEHTSGSLVVLSTLQHGRGVLWAHLEARPQHHHPTQ